MFLVNINKAGEWVDIGKQSRNHRSRSADQKHCSQIPNTPTNPVSGIYFEPAPAWPTDSTPLSSWKSYKLKYPASALPSLLIHLYIICYQTGVKKDRTNSSCVTTDDHPHNCISTALCPMWRSSLSFSDLLLLGRRSGFVPTFSHVLHLSSWKTSTLCYKLGLPLELLKSSYSFFHSNGFLIIYKAYLLRGDCFGMIIWQRILPDIIYSVTLQHLQHPTYRSLQQKYCSNYSKNWNCQMLFHIKEK